MPAETRDLLASLLLRKCEGKAQESEQVTKICAPIGSKISAPIGSCASPALPAAAAQPAPRALSDRERVIMTARLALCRELDRLLPVSYTHLTLPTSISSPPSGWENCLPCSHRRCGQPWGKTEGRDLVSAHFIAGMPIIWLAARQALFPGFRARRTLRHGPTNFFPTIKSRSTPPWCWPMPI